MKSKEVMIVGGWGGVGGTKRRKRLKVCSRVTFLPLFVPPLLNVLFLLSSEQRRKNWSITHYSLSIFNTITIGRILNYNGCKNDFAMFDVCMLPGK